MSSKKNIAIEVKNVSKDFILPHKKRGTLKSFFLNPFSNFENERQHALSNASLEIKEGEFFGIVGKNGSGKSTLLKCMAGVYTPEKGHIEVNGSIVPFIELGVGFNPELSGRDNVFLSGSLLGFSRQETNNMYEEIVEFSELEKFMDQKLKNYSSGMQVRLAFSIAIQAKGDILLLDEVLAVGDNAFQQKCFNYFEDIKDEKRTVVFVSHSMDAIKRFCAKAVYMKEGKIIKEGTPSDIADVYTLENLVSGNDKRSEQEKNYINVKVVGKTPKSVKLRFNYKYGGNEDLFIGLSVLRNGVSVAEITTDKNKQLKPESRTEYTLDDTFLNPGVYSIGGGLFKTKNKEQVCGVGREGRIKFIIGGQDYRRGAALKLKDTWHYE